MEKALLTIKETADYLGIGLTKTRELVKQNSWSMRIGNRWYINKKLLDKWLSVQCNRNMV